MKTDNRPLLKRGKTSKIKTFEIYKIAKFHGLKTKDLRFLED